MNQLTTVLVGLGLVAFVGCESDTTTPGSSADPFAGKWSCAEERSIEITTSAGTTMTQTTVMTTLNISSKDGTLTASSDSDSGSSCTLTFSVSGNTATLVDGQTCQIAGGISLTYTAGSSTLSGNTITSTLSYDAAGMAGGGPATGKGSTTSTCSRIGGSPTTGGGTTGGW